MSSVYLRAAGVLLAVLVLAGCGGDDGDGADDPQKVGQTAALTQYEVASEGFSVGVPPAWTALSADERPTQEQIDELLGDNPKFQPYLEAMAGEDSLIKFMAVDPGGDPQLPTNLNIVVESPPTGVTREQYFDATNAQIDQLVPTGNVEADQVSLPAGEALHLSYEHSEAGFPVAVVQYVLFEGGTGYTLTFTPSQTSSPGVPQRSSARRARSRSLRPTRRTRP